MRFGLASWFTTSAFARSVSDAAIARWHTISVRPVIAAAMIGNELGRERYIASFRVNQRNALFGDASNGMLNLYAHLGTTTIGRIHYVESGPDWTAFQATEAHWPAAAEPGWAPSELVPSLTRTWEIKRWEQGGSNACRFRDSHPLLFARPPAHSAFVTLSRSDRSSGHGENSGHSCCQSSGQVRSTILRRCGSEGWL